MRSITTLLLITLNALAGCASPPRGCAFNAAYINDPAVYWPQGPVAGKVFRVDEAEMCFDLVKNVVYDKTSGEGMARHCVYWSDTTRFIRRDTLKDFTGLDKPVAMKLELASENEAEKFRQGKPFAVRHATVLPETDQVEVVQKEIVAVVTITGPKAGTVPSDAGPIPFTMTRRGASIVSEQPFDAADLDDGHWTALVAGAQFGDRFVLDRVTVSPRPDPLEGEDLGLPRVLVIGDSISMNYHEAAKAALAGTANYKRNEGNAFSSQYGMQYADYWLGDYTAPGQQWDVIQFNFGLHDLKQPAPDAPYATPLDDYKRQLRRVIERLRPTGATLIFATTTPVPKSSGGRFGRQQGAEIAFNNAAREVLADYPEIRFNDLCKVVNESEVFDAGFRKTADVHYYKPEEQAALGQAVADAVKQALRNRQGD